MFVYRFVKLAEFIDIAVHQRMTLTQIASWPDKHETATLATALKYRTRHTALDVPAHERADDTRQRIEALRSAYFNIYLQSQYAMCFTTKENSDAMWKVFAGETGVRLAIDCDLLLPALQKENANVKGGDVSYHPEGKPMSEVLKESGISSKTRCPSYPVASSNAMPLSTKRSTGSASRSIPKAMTPSWNP